MSNDNLVSDSLHQLLGLSRFILVIQTLSDLIIYNLSCCQDNKYETTPARLWQSLHDGLFGYVYVCFWVSSGVSNLFL